MGQNLKCSGALVPYLGKYLDHLLILNGRQLHTVLKVYLASFTHARPPVATQGLFDF